jgi:hypothetical protein
MLAIRVIDERIKREERTPRATSPPQQQRRASLPGQDVAFGNAKRVRGNAKRVRTPRATSPPQQRRASLPIHKKDPRCVALFKGDLWKYAKGRDVVGDDLYETVIRPCFVHRLRDAAEQKGRERRQPGDDRGLGQNWSHDVVLAQYGRIAKRMENRKLANVLDAVSHVSRSLDRYILRPPSKQEQSRNRMATFKKRYVLEAQSSRNTHAHLKALASRFL